MDGKDGDGMAGGVDGEEVIGGCHGGGGGGGGAAGTPFWPSNIKSSSNDVMLLESLSTFTS